MSKPERVNEFVKRMSEKTGTKRKLSASNPIADLLLGTQNYVIVYPVIARMLGGDINAAVLLCKAWHWANTPTAQARDGWFWWSQVDITKQTGLSKRRTENARQILRECKILQNVVKGQPPTVWWYIDKEQFFAQLTSFIDSEEDSEED